MAPFLTLYTFLQSGFTSVEARIASREEKGAVAIEYALLATLIALAIVLAVTGVGTALKNIFNAVAGKLVVPAVP